MIDWKKHYLSGVTFISYNEGLKGYLLLENEDAIIPIELKEKDLEFITLYPNIMKKLMNGKELYLNFLNGYLGKKETEGPYCEQKIFVSEYDCTNPNLNELICDIENRIKKEKTNIKKLSKLGIYYK